MSVIKDEIERLQRIVEDISSNMKGPMNDSERAYLHFERKDIRARIAQLQQLEVTDAER